MGGRDTHLGAAVDGLTEPDMLHALCAPEPVLLGDALRLGIDASLTGGKVAEDLDGVVVAALVGVNPVESCKRKKPSGWSEQEETGGENAARELGSMLWSSPLVHSGWLSLMSRQVRAGFFLDPSGESRFSIWVLRDLMVASTS